METSWTGSSDCEGATSDPPFTRALRLLDEILTNSPDLATHVKDLDIYLPNEDGLGVPYRVDGVEEGTSGYSGDWVNGRHEVAEEKLFPRIVARLTNIRKLRVSVGSYQCQRRCPPRFRIDWDILSHGLRSGFTTLFKRERLEDVELAGVVIPPRMLFGLGIGAQPGESGVLSRLKRLELVAHCPISTKRLQQIEEFGRARSPFSMMSIGSSLEGEFNAFQYTSPLRSAAPSSLHVPTLTTLHLGFCDSEFLRYISTVYPDAFMGLKNLSLNIIEKDLDWCQRFLDVIAGSPSAESSAIGGVQKRGLESFDCTIRCNTQASFFGLFSLHALDFSRCASLKHLSLKYLLLSQVTEAVKRAMEVNIATALSSLRLEEGQDNERGCDGNSAQRKGVETMHLVIDWAFNGDLILLDAFKDLDRIVEDAYYTTSHSSGARGDSRRKNLNLEAFKIEATHWPCPDAGNCGFRREVTTPPALIRSPSTSGSLSSPTPTPSHPASDTVSRRPTPLRTSSSPHPYRGVHSHPSDEGNLAKFFPFLTNLRGLEDGVDFESKYVLEHRRELGPGLMM